MGLGVRSRIVAVRRLGADLLGYCIWLFQTLLCRQPGIRLAVPDSKCGTILVNRLVALILNVVEPPQVDMGPGQRSGILGKADGFFEVMLSSRHIAMHDGHPRQDEVRSCRIAGLVGDRLLREYGGAVRVTLH